jgi:CDP-alcohol phosphatidyltransferase
MSAPDDLALKGKAVEEWLDLRFFRPVGIKIARALEPSSVSANQVTLGSLVVGLLAAHLFVYASPWINALGLALVVVADLLDSADGQLARLRGTASRVGRILDGYADNLRWTVIYVHIMVRLMLDGWGWRAFALAFVAGGCHSLHSAIVDFIYGAYLEIAAGMRGQADLPEDVSGDRPALSRSAGWWWRSGVAFYAAFTRRQARLFPRTTALLRRSRVTGLDPETRARYAARQRPLLSVCPWIGQNAHIAVLGAAVVSGRPALFFWAIALVMTPIGAALVLLHERAVKRLGP